MAKTTKKTGSPSAPRATLAEVLGTFSEETIKQVPDKGVRDSLQGALAFIKGAAAILIDREKPAFAEDARKLDEIHVSLDDLRAIASDGVALIALVATRDAREAAYRTAVHDVQDAEAGITDHTRTHTYLLRGKFGPKSPELKRFGIAPLASGGRRAAKTAKKDTPGTP